MYSLDPCFMELGSMTVVSTASEHSANDPWHDGKNASLSGENPASKP